MAETETETAAIELSWKLFDYTGASCSSVQSK